MKHNQLIGKWGEQTAASYLEGKGYKILERNVRTPFGEIDIVASLDGFIIFIEVKARTSQTFGLPEEALNPRKLDHMQQCAEYYAGLKEFETWQCDAISVEGRPGAEPVITHFENVTK
jgi:putative endonuclease